MHQPITTAVPTGWRARLDVRPALGRVRDSGLAIVQIVVAASAAYAFARYVVGHPAPLLAGTVTISSLGLVRDARPRRVALTVVGMLVGVLVAELVVLLTGPGWWQLGLTLGVTLVVARFLSSFPPFAIMAGVQSVIVMAMPVVQPFGRLLDGAVGGAAALLVTALIPRNPRREELRDGHALLRAFHGAAAAVAQALRRGDRRRAERGLEKARAVGADVDRWRDALDSGLAVARISPFLRRQRAELQRHDRIRQALDYATRNLRVIARRAAYQCDDGVPRPTAAEVLEGLIHGAELIAQSLEDVSAETLARDELLAIARRLDPDRMLPGASLGDRDLIVALRPLAVDLLTAAGVGPADARAALPRI